MVSDGNSGAAAAVHGRKFSTVVPGSVTGDSVVHHFADMDLVVKLHYLRYVFFFEASEVTEGLKIVNLKEPMFPMLDMYYPVAGRIRQSEAGRPLVKCNDSGVRIIEANCDKTIGEWLELKEVSRDQPLASEKTLGPDLLFSPSVYVQFTRFKCGGMAVGFSWAHVLGDAISAINSINMWGQNFTGKKPAKLLCQPKSQTETKKPAKEKPDADKALPVKQVEPVQDCWLNPKQCKMGTFSFQIAETKIKHILSQISAQTVLPPFEVLSAIIWRCLARIREGQGPHSVTICRNSSEQKSRTLGNDQTISIVTCEQSPANVQLPELAMLISEGRVDLQKEIEELVDKESGKPDFILYGANLTFVDMEQVEFYGVELKGQKPVHASCNIDGVGDEGAVLILPSTEANAGTGVNGGRVITVILPEDQIPQLREMLQTEYSIA